MYILSDFIYFRGNLLINKTPIDLSELDCNETEEKILINFTEVTIYSYFLFYIQVEFITCTYKLLKPTLLHTSRSIKHIFTLNLKHFIISLNVKK